MIELMKQNIYKFFLSVVIFFSIPVHSQDSVAVTFRYKPQNSVSVVYLPGSFNNWGNNVNGVISDKKFAMEYDSVDNEWKKTVKLLPGIYNYKFNEDGVRWFTDPNNPLINFNDNNNSIINVSDPMFFYTTYLQPTDQISPFIIRSNIFYSDAKPVKKDSVFLYVNNILKTTINNSFDYSKKLFSYPLYLDDGLYKIKLIAKNDNGGFAIDSLTIRASRRPNVKNPVPCQFIYDEKSSFSSYKNVNSVSVPGSFNNWNTNANKLTYDAENKFWYTNIYLYPGEYEYKFYLNGSIWTEDPDNPVTKGSYGNSVIKVNPIDNPYFTNFSIKDRLVSSDSFNILTCKIQKSSYDASIIESSIKIYHNNKEVNFIYNPSNEMVTINLLNEFIEEGLHDWVFECSDSLGFKAKNYLSYEINKTKESYISIDPKSDEYLDYPNEILKGAADIRRFSISTNYTVDTLIINVLMDKITNNTRISLSIFNQITGKYIPDFNNLNINIPEWSLQGFFVNIVNPKSQFFDSLSSNRIITSYSPIKYGKSIPVDVNNNSFIIKLSTKDINDILGDYNDKRYFILYSYLCNDNGEILKYNKEDATVNQPYIYDIAFATREMQERILNNFNVSRFTRLDAEGRGLAGITAEEINPLLKSQGPTIKILNPSNLELTVSYKIIEGTVNDPEISKVDIYRNDKLFSTAQVTDKKFSAYILLLEGDNFIKAVAKNSQGFLGTSNVINLRYIVDHSPVPKISFIDKGNVIEVTAINSTDPDNDIDRYEWSSDDKNSAEKLSITYEGISFEINKPKTKGEYYFNLKAIDKQNNISSTRNYFILNEDLSITIPTIQSNPQWVKDAIVYEIFVKSFSSEGNLNSITKNIKYLKDLGINTLWLMPIMHNQGGISDLGGGYAIDDFYNIAPQYGNFNDFKVLLDSAHNNGIKIILDITPNHVADKHPWVEDIRVFGKYSNYYNYIERRKLGDDRGLGQSLNSDNIYMRYSNWTLANLNLENQETVNYMINMFNWWLNNIGADGFRFDVYWGPQNRYGKEAFWRPVREKLKNKKPDIFLLGETDGTGTGSEINYADNGGACDAAYDWLWYSTVKSIFSNRNSDNLHNRVTNYGFSPGDNSYFFRFLENHDEDRCATFFNNDQNKTALALLMTIPGIPMIYMGQEVGWKGKRNLISFSTSDAEILFPFYKRMILARSKYPALRSRTINRIETNDKEIYSYTRKYKDQNFIVIINLSNSNKNLNIKINEKNDLDLSIPLSSEKIYYLNDFANDTSYQIRKSNFENITFSLKPYESKVMLLSEEKIKIISSISKPDFGNVPSDFSISQNYPNPFNPSTCIEYTLPEASNVKLVIYDILGKEVAVLVDEHQGKGKYRINFNATNLSSGVYLYRFSTSKFAQTKKMVLAK